MMMMMRSNNDDDYTREVPQITVRFLDNAGGGFAEEIETDKDITVQDFCNRQDVDTVKNLVKVNGEEFLGGDEILEEGDKISVTPKNVKGA
jgi:sulfur carrier protein ThiS